MKPIDEATEVTRARLERISRVELAGDIESGRAVAAGVDGSLGSGRIWPSSDVDITVVPVDGPDWGVEWLVRDGVVIHKHINGWGLLNRLQADYPQSFIDTATGDWIRDPTWLLDGLASIQPVYDPDGRLAQLRGFMRERRFRAEVIEPRRPLLLQRSTRFFSSAKAAFDQGDEAECAWPMSMAMESLALIWLEAAGRMISFKEMDSELKAACDKAGAPEAHSLFRAVAGLTGLENHLPAIDRALAALYDFYSPWVDRTLAEVEGCDRTVKRHFAGFAYRRHQFHSARCAIPRGCWLHLADVRGYVETLPVVLNEICAKLGKSGVSTPDYAPSNLEERCQDVIEAFPLNPIPDRLAALKSLQAITASHPHGLPGCH